MKISFLLLVFVAISCGQLSVPGYLAWDYDYTYAHPDTTPADSVYLFKMTDEDSSHTNFNVYYSYTDSNFTKLDSTYALEYYLLGNQEFYSNIFVWFYATAEIEPYVLGSLLKGNVESFPSDTIMIYFPKLSPNEPIELEVLELNMK